MRDAAVARLRDKQGDRCGDQRGRASCHGGAVSGGEHGLAPACHLQRRVRTRTTYQLSEADRDAYLDWCGSVAALRRARLAQGKLMPSLRTLQRAFVEQMTPSEPAAPVEGRRAGTGIRVSAVGVTGALYLDCYSSDRGLGIVGVSEQRHRPPGCPPPRLSGSRTASPLPGAADP
jgi:hypothetical protein